MSRRPSAAVLDDRARTIVPLSPVAYHVLLALADRNRHGLGIADQVEAATGGHIALGPGTLYGAITRLEERGWIRAVAAKDRRQPYTITAAGRRYLEEQTATLEKVVRTAARRLKHA